MTATVAVEGAAYHYDREYTYSVPESMAEAVLPGCRIRVPFGRSNATRTAVVLSRDAQMPPDGCKPVLETLDTAPLLDAEGIMLLRYLKDTTFCTWFDALKLLIPAGLGYAFRTEYALGDVIPGTLSEPQRRVIEYVRAKGKKGPVPAARICEELSVEERGPELAGLLECGALIKLESHRRQIQDDKVIMARLTGGWEELKLTARQKQVARFLLDAESASLKEILYYTGVTRAVPDAMRDKGALEYYEHVMSRNPYADSSQAALEDPPELSPDQLKAFEQLREHLDSGRARPALLHGVTGSGKTQVYFRLIEHVTARGKGAILLVPEISLTAQTLAALRARFGSRVAVLHSGLSLGERMDEWRRVKSGGADIVAGTRSAVFAPVKNLGLIVVDEEQEHTYKSERSPRYHAREVARVRCAAAGGMLLLTSATPSVESYHAATRGRYELAQLTGRFGDAKLPDVRVVDMGDAQNLSDSPFLSLELREELYYNLEHGEQSILLLNRRGHSTLVRCSSCGDTAGCPNCSVSMTYHAANDMLVCHYCGHSRRRERYCTACGSELMRYSGPGTQRLEQELSEVFPKARLLRVDTDTTMSRFSHEKLFGAFAAGEYDIMLGTQMVAKGLNFPGVTLVGVMSADQALYSGDFRSFERAFSLLTQVMGRSGRAGAGGRAIIQTYSPDSPIIRLASRQDYPAFFAQEIQSRRLHLYPPFCAMVGIGFTGADNTEALNAARAFLEDFRVLAAAEYPELPLRMLGPAPAEVLKAAGRFRYKLILKCNNNARTRALLAALLYRFHARPGKVGVFVDFYYDGI